ncbi:MAG: AbrB/MazE/SpoVT family DNA-binding domain-containing protein [Nanoarchaeota archaeon]
MTLIEIKSSKITKKGQIAIPKDIRDIEGFKEGSKIAILAFEDRVELRPLDKVNERTFTAIASEKALAKDWSSKEDEEAWKNL